MVDTGGIGSEPGDDQGRRVVAPFLRHLGCDHIDALILTHPHSDHIGGATLLRHFQVDHLFDNGQKNGDAEMTGVLEAARERGTTRTTAAPGTALDCSVGVTIEMLPPTVIERAGTPNNASVVLHMRYGRPAFLLTSDVEAPEQDRRVLPMTTDHSDNLNDTLIAAIKAGQMEAVQALLAQGAAPNCRDRMGNDESALILAFDFKYGEGTTLSCCDDLTIVTALL